MSILPLEVYGAEPSYFTGKLEAVLRYKGIPYTRISRAPDSLKRETGVAQVPAMRLADGRWMTDTTPIIAWLEGECPEHPVIPADPSLAFFSRLVEDFADEWLWRPAMHYRWDYAEDAAHMSRVLANELMGHIRAPGAFKRWVVRRRQRGLFTRTDGVTPETWDHVERIYLDALDHLGAILATRPYLLGDRPSLADFGYFGPMFRHFALDPTASRIMREQASSVYEWVARVWNARGETTTGELSSGLPEDWSPILDAIGRAYLPSLCANAEAWKAGQKLHDFEVEGVRYRNIRVAPYRVWCLEELRRHFEALPEESRSGVRARLEQHGCWEPLWRVEGAKSGVDPQGEAPFAPGYSMTGLDDR